MQTTRHGLEATILDEVKCCQLTCIETQEAGKDCFWKIAHKYTNNSSFQLMVMESDVSQSNI